MLTVMANRWYSLRKMVCEYVRVSCLREPRLFLSSNIAGGGGTFFELHPLHNLFQIFSCAVLPVGKMIFMDLGVSLEILKLSRATYKKKQNKKKKIKIGCLRHFSVHSISDQYCCFRAWNISICSINCMEKGVCSK